MKAAHCAATRSFVLLNANASKGRARGGSSLPVADDIPMHATLLALYPKVRLPKCVRARRRGYARRPANATHCRALVRTCRKESWRAWGQLSSILMVFHVGAGLMM